MTPSEKNLKDSQKRNKFKNNKNKEDPPKILKGRFSLHSLNPEIYKNHTNNLKKLLPVKRISSNLKKILFPNINKTMKRNQIET